ncbi:hypothetical protein SeLEV6574_g04017 [Synchytrium endobioticum]|uniref:Uncharacterized protein n=1 Tax=Synchytrium endobioticum TaxID=286115 RepID=A0A507D157_9FUNG|nr:hypothetical protein SeLEV6574_g04017 [Synchytrium endobioticum]
MGTSLTNQIPSVVPTIGFTHINKIQDLVERQGRPAHKDSCVAQMLSCLVIVLLVLPLHHIGHAIPYYTCGQLDNFISALRQRKPLLTHVSREFEGRIQDHIMVLANPDADDHDALMTKVHEFALSLAIPADVPFTADSLVNPTSDMSPRYLEYHWEALENLVEAMYVMEEHLLAVANEMDDPELAEDAIIAADSFIDDLHDNYEKILVRRVVHGSLDFLSVLQHHRGTVPPLGRMSKSPFMSIMDLLTLASDRVAEKIATLEKNEHTATISSLTQAEFVMTKIEITDVIHETMRDTCAWADEFYGISELPQLPERFNSHEKLSIATVFHTLVAQAMRLIMLEVSHFLKKESAVANLEDWQKTELAELRDASAQMCERRKDELRYIRRCVYQWFRSWNGLSNLDKYLMTMCTNLRRLEAADDFGGDAAITEIRHMLDSNYLDDIQKIDWLPADTRFLFDLTPVPDEATIKYLTLVAWYHLLLVWRSRQRLSRLQWLKNRYTIELLDDPVVTVERVNEAETKIIKFAQKQVALLDAYAEAAEAKYGHLPRKYWVSDEDRKDHLKLLGVNSNHLTTTWKKIVGSNIQAYISTVEAELKTIKSQTNVQKSSEYDERDANVYQISRLVEILGFDLLAQVRQIHDLPPEVNHLIEAVPVPESLPPEYLRLAAAAHQLVVFRLCQDERLLESFREQHVLKPSKPITADMVDKKLSILSNYLPQRMELFAAYEKAAAAVGVGMLPDREDYFKNMASTNAVTTRGKTGLNADDGAKALGYHEPGSAIMQKPEPAAVDRPSGQPGHQNGVDDRVADRLDASTHNAEDNSVGGIKRTFVDSTKNRLESDNHQICKVNVPAQVLRDAAPSDTGREDVEPESELRVADRAAAVNDIHAPVDGRWDGAHASSLGGHGRTGFEGGSGHMLHNPGARLHASTPVQNDRVGIYFGP